MRAYPLVVVALSLIAGSAGFVTHRALLAGSEPTAAVAVITAAPAPASRSAPDSPLEWSFMTLTGESKALSSWPGKVTVLNFWATWCPPCLREIPAFMAIQNELGADGVQFIGIALDQVEAVTPFVADKGVNYPILVGDADVIRFMQTLGNEIGGLPYTAVIDAHGEVLFTHQGEWHAEDARQILTGALATP